MLPKDATKTICVLMAALQALTMTTPRSTKVMTEKFGISQPDTDVRALLINPAKWAEDPQV